MAVYMFIIITNKDFVVLLVLLLFCGPYGFRIVQFRLRWGVLHSLPHYSRCQRPLASLDIDTDGRESGDRKDEGRQR